MIDRKAIDRIPDDHLRKISERAEFIRDRSGQVMWLRLLGRIHTKEQDWINDRRSAQS
jgi:hypothetical protein